MDKSTMTNESEKEDGQVSLRETTVLELQGLDADIERRKIRLRELKRDQESRNAEARHYYESVVLDGRLKFLEEKMEINRLQTRRTRLQMEAIQRQYLAEQAEQEALDKWAMNP